jgi:hypothetical protein
MRKKRVAFHRAGWKDMGDPALKRDDLVVWNPTIPVDQARGACREGAVLLAAVNMGLVPYWGQRSEFGKDQLGLFSADGSMVYRNEDGSWIEHSSYKSYFVKPVLDTGYLLARFWAERLSEWDGVYVDEFIPGISGSRLTKLGLMEERVWVQPMYEAYFRFTLAYLRKLLPDEKVIVGNVSKLSSRYRLQYDAKLRWDRETLGFLDGITLERPKINDLGYFWDVAHQVWSRGRKALNVAWYSDWDMVDEDGDQVVMAGEVRG